MSRHEPKEWFQHDCYIGFSRKSFCFVFLFFGVCLGGGAWSWAQAAAGGSGLVGLCVGWLCWCVVISAGEKGRMVFFPHLYWIHILLLP